MYINSNRSLDDIHQVSIDFIQWLVLKKATVMQRGGETLSLGTHNYLKSGSILKTRADLESALQGAQNGGARFLINALWC